MPCFCSNINGTTNHRSRPVAGTPEVEIVTATENFESRNNFKGEEKLPFEERSEGKLVDLWGVRLVVLGVSDWILYIYIYNYIDIYWVLPPPSNSDHQDYYIFNRESL